MPKKKLDEKILNMIGHIKSQIETCSDFCGEAQAIELAERLDQLFFDTDQILENAERYFKNN